ARGYVRRDYTHGRSGTAFCDTGSSDLDRSGLATDNRCIFVFTADSGRISYGHRSLMPTVLSGAVPGRCFVPSVPVIRARKQTKIPRAAWDCPVAGRRIGPGSFIDRDLGRHYQSWDGHRRVVARLERLRGFEPLQAGCCGLLFLFLSSPTDLSGGVALPASISLAGAPSCLDRWDRGWMSWTFAASAWPDPGFCFDGLTMAGRQVHSSRVHCRSDRLQCDRDWPASLGE